jgi:hypothetical protein
VPLRHQHPAVVDHGGTDHLDDVLRGPGSGGGVGVVVRPHGAREPTAQEQLVDERAGRSAESGAAVDLLGHQRARARGGEAAGVREPAPTGRRSRGVDVPRRPLRDDLLQRERPRAAQRSRHVERDGEGRVHQGGEAQPEHPTTLAEPP